MIQFTSLSPKSTVAHLKYQTSQVSCFYLDETTGKRYRIIFLCPPIRGCFYSNIPISILNEAQCNFKNLTSLLDVNDKGKYIIKNNDSYAKCLVNGSVIALGLDATNYPYLASIGLDIGGVFLSVPVRSEADIIMEEISKKEWDEEEKIIKNILKKREEYENRPNSP